MKYVAFIFSIYFTLLALLPCQDREDMIASVMHTTVQKSHSPNNERGQETCPPFCTCSCCSTARILSSNVKVGGFIKPITRVYPDYAIPALRKQLIKIWQPPQIA
ncbi:DUF6660 family protein [Mucilaginibacter sp.]|uniref:DUF6660 family protein n=1 Tax=Mucilaginibacter sp. TaxID=1882438 RepID=UPI00374CAAAE